MSSDSVYAFEQLFSLGVLWVTFHCIGMCGPLVVGLRVDQNEAKKVKVVRNVLLYQTGRALTYVFLGFLCGLIGQSVQKAFSDVGALLSLSVGLAFISFSILFLLPNRAEKRVTIGTKKSLSERALSFLTVRIAEMGQRRTPLGTLFLGVMMGFLPCMITFWVLGLALVSGSALMGALLMFSLVLMTTPVILFAALSSSILAQNKHLRLAPKVLMVISGVWFVMIGLSAFEVVSHAHLNFEIMERPFTVMFW